MTDGSGAKSMWEERYHADHYLYGTEPNGSLRANVTALPMGDVLCLAEGEGRNSVFLASTGRKVSSVDLTEAEVTKTLRLAAELASWSTLSPQTSRTMTPARIVGTASSRSSLTSRYDRSGTWWRELRARAHLDLELRRTGEDALGRSLPDRLLPTTRSVAQVP